MTRTVQARNRRRRARGRGDGTLNLAVAANAAARQPHQPRRAYHRALPTRPRSLIGDARRRDRTPIWPDPAVTGSHRVTAPVRAGAAPEDVRHWFDRETILESPTPTTSFD
jgi:hypothetical protein